jgi:hypothetical protein
MSKYDISKSLISLNVPFIEEMGRVQAQQTKSSHIFAHTHTTSVGNGTYLGKG